MQGQAGRFGVPVLRCVQGEAATAGAGEPGRYLDQVLADGGPAGLGVEQGDQAAGGAQQVLGDRGEGDPGRVGVEVTRGYLKSALGCLPCSFTRL